MSKDFTIKRSITKTDIPPKKTFRKSKYDPIYTSCGTLEPDEGIEVTVKGYSARNTIQKGLKKRYPRRYYQLSVRNLKDGCHLFIVRLK
jgi:hypothetical protein